MYVLKYRIIIRNNSCTYKFFFKRSNIFLIFIVYFPCSNIDILLIILYNMQINYYRVKI